MERRQAYKNKLTNQPLLDITRLEVIDHTKPLEEGGGRTVIFWDENKKVQSSVQDEGRTLKLFVSEREEDEKV